MKKFQLFVILFDMFVQSSMSTTRSSRAPNNGFAFIFLWAVPFKGNFPSMRSVWSPHMVYAATSDR